MLHIGAYKVNTLSFIRYTQCLMTVAYLLQSES